jgi:glycine/D-amino acid oxidase-like deaminating enzyme
MLIVGPRISLIETGTPQPDWQTSAAFDRNVRAFGGAVQRMLAHLNVAIVGCGGTGSSVAEQLVRLGVRRLTLLDPEDVSETNITRLYGSTAADIGTPKVKVLENYLSRIAPELQVDAVQGMVTRESLARRLSAADVIFGCTDDNAGRLVLSRLSTYLMVPVIDGGVLLSSGLDGTLSGIDGRVTLMYPGAACLVCRGRVDLQRAASESLTPDERVRRVDEGYAPGLGGAEPAVVAFTTVVAAAAVSELLNALIGYGPEPHPTEILLRLHDREVSTNVAKPQSGHYCDPSSGKIGRGVTVPFLEKTWPS